MIERCTDGVLGQPDQLGVGAPCSEDLGIVHSDHASPLALERASHHGCAAGLSATTHDLVYELEQIVVQLGSRGSRLYATPLSEPVTGRVRSAALLIYSMGVSVDGFIADRDGAFGWTVPDEELFGFHLARVRELGCHLCGRKLYETMLVWETDPSLRDTELHAAFADVWCALPKVVFSRTLDSVQGNARLADGSVEEEVAAALAATDKDIEIGGAGLAATTIELGLVDELRMFRHPIIVGGGTPFLPPITADVQLELIETRTFGSRVIYERYRRIRGDTYRHF